MTSKEIKNVLDRVLTWPQKRQRDVAQVVRLMEEQDKSPLRLTENQAAEVRRRLKEKNPKTISFTTFKKHLHKRYGV